MTDHPSIHPNDHPTNSPSSPEPLATHPTDLTPDAPPRPGASARPELWFADRQRIETTHLDRPGATGVGPSVSAADTEGADTNRSPNVANHDVVVPTAQC